MQLVSEEGDARRISRSFCDKAKDILIDCPDVISRLAKTTCVMLFIMPYI